MACTGGLLFLLSYLFYSFERGDALNAKVCSITTSQYINKWVGSLVLFISIHAHTLFLACCYRILFVRIRCSSTLLHRVSTLQSWLVWMYAFMNYGRRPGCWVMDRKLVHHFRLHHQTLRQLQQVEILRTTLIETVHECELITESFQRHYIHIIIILLLLIILIIMVIIIKIQNITDKSFTGIFAKSTR